jgi:predicted nucleic acid-binding protein
VTVQSLVAVPTACVVDASVGIKLFLAEDYSDHAHALFARLADDPPAQFFVPDLFYIECASILWKSVRRLSYPRGRTRQDLEDLGRLLLQSIPTEELMTEALELALDHDITAYDASYLALAQQLGVPLITADAKLFRSLSTLSGQILWVGDLPLPSPPGT